MTEQPTYEELEQRVKEFEKEAFKRKPAEDALVENERFLQNIFDGIQDGISVLDPELNIIRVNYWMEKIYSDQQPLIGKKCYEVYQQRERMCPWCPSVKSIETGEPHSKIVPYPTEENPKGWLDISSFPIKDAEGRVVAVIEHVKDITDRKRVEEALRESEKWYRLLADNVRDVIWIRDMAMRLTYISPSILELQDYTVKEAMAKTPEEIWLPDSLKLVGEVLAEELEIENQEEKDLSRSRTLEIEVKCKDGSTLWTEAKVSFLRDQNGDPTGIIGVTRDISERKRAELALIESEERYRSLVENTIYGFFIHEIPSGRFLFLNQRACELYGYTMQEGLELAVWDALSSKDHEHIKKRVQARVEGKELGPDIQTYTAVRKDGSTFRLEVSSSLIIFQGRPAVHGIVRDVTEQEHLEQQLIQSQRMEAIGTLAGGVAHDLNNILSGIVSYPELILMDLSEGSPLRKPILTIQKSGEKAAIIVQDLLTLARRGVSITDVVNLNNIISEQLKSPECEKLISFHPDVHTKTNLEKDLLNIKGSSTHLSKSVMNILSNAAEAMPGGGTILVSTENLYLDRPIKGYDHVESGEYVTVTFSDTGIGIPEEDAERIFEPFYTKKVMGRSGTGLGMAVVWGTVKDHKGYIDIQSTVGKGTTFTLYFPVTREEVGKDESLLPIADYMGKGESILVVDDVEEQRDIATGMLRKLGYSITSVSSGEEAVEYLKTNSADLIVLDMIMEPGINGRETYERIINLNPNQKAIIASGFSETDDVKAAQKLGAGQYIKKPYTLEKIGIAVRDELKK
jgi:PAS domain S-box-containing protein